MTSRLSSTIHTNTSVPPRSFYRLKNARYPCLRYERTAPQTPCGLGPVLALLMLARIVGFLRYIPGKVPLRDLPKAVAQERIERHTACDIVSYAYDIILRRYELSVLLYLWQHACITQQPRPAGLQTAGSDNKSNEEATVIHRGQTTAYACGVDSCSANRRQACIAL